MLYLCLVIFAVLVTLFALAPVLLHRLLFQEHAKAQLVHAASVILIVCLVAASLLFVGIVLFVFDFVVSPTAGLWAGSRRGPRCPALDGWAEVAEASSRPRDTRLPECELVEEVSRCLRRAGVVHVAADHGARIR